MRSRRHKEVQNLSEFVLKPQMASTLVSGGRVILIRFGMKKLKSQVMSKPTPVRRSHPLLGRSLHRKCGAFSWRLHKALLTEFVAEVYKCGRNNATIFGYEDTNSLGGLPFKSGSGAWFIPSFTEENTHLETRELFKSPNYFGDRNALNRETTQTYFDESGKPRKWYRQSQT